MPALSAELFETTKSLAVGYAGTTIVKPVPANYRRR
jgi:hypothetical protein